MSIAATNQRAAAAVMQTLVAGGVRDVVASPGSRNTPLVLAADATPTLRTHTVLDERSAGFVALGVAVETGRPVAITCTSGSAGAHLLPALVEARHSRVPLVVITADRPRRLHDIGAPQTTDQSRLFGAHAVWRAELDTPGPGDDARTRQVVARACLLSGEGPVHLNAPFDAPLWSATADTAPPVTPPVRARRGEAHLDEGDIAALVERWEGRRGVFVCGPITAGTTRDRGATVAAIASLATRLRWPVLADASSGLRFGGHDLTPLIASYDALLREPTFARAAAPEVVVRVGQAPCSKAVGQWLESLRDTDSYVIDRAGDWHGLVPGRATLLAVEPHTALAAVAARVRRADASPYLETWRRADAAARSILEAACSRGTWGGAIARSLVGGLRRARLHVASSMAVRDLDSFAPALPSRLAISANRGQNGIDGTIATAAGRALVPGDPVVAWLGDLAFAHDVGGFLAARALGAPLTLVVVNNGGGRIFDHLPIAAHPTAFERRFVAPQPTDIAALAGAVGADLQRVDAASELARALRAPSDRRLRVIELAVDPREDLERHHAAWSAVAAAARAHAEE